jgi:hypothetical protein
MPDARCRMPDARKINVMKNEDTIKPVRPGDLKENWVYFLLDYVDREFLIPTLQATIYIGRNLNKGDQGLIYFQDAKSFYSGLRYSGGSPIPAADIFTISELEEDTPVVEYENALAELAECEFRRKSAGLS